MPETTADTPVYAANALAQVYARSLIELTEQDGAPGADEIGDELAQLVALLHEHPPLRQLLGSPSIKADERAGTIERLFKGRVSDLLYRFLQVVNRKGRLTQLEAIHGAYQQLLKQKRGEVDVEAWTARPMSDEQTKLVAEKVGQALNRKALIHARVDEAIIGGLKLRIGDRLIDGSVATQLHRMRHTLLQRGRDAARRGMDRMLTE